MALQPGFRLGPYSITSQIGAGGMGEVYRAIDSRLDRSVAIKVLPTELSTNVQLQRRFEREARTISQLNHPNICTVHDVGQQDGTIYLVMELLEGETLAERLARGRLSVAEVVNFGAQIAEGLDRAHRSGIVHRDLKPANIMLTKSGAKLLDFGLAKAPPISIAHDDATQQNPLTQEGAILGTFQYMAPEQLEGLEADVRSDIFALGAVLYEMITGNRAFDGRSKTSVIAAIVTAQPPPISRLQPLAPSSLEHIVTRCLQKDPDERWQCARDVAHQLKWAPSDVSSERHSSPRNAASALLGAALAVVIAGAVVTLYLRQSTRQQPAVAFSIAPPPGQTLAPFALSPDGQRIAFTTRDEDGTASLWVRALSSIEAKRLTTSVTTSAPGKPFWSPDSKSIAFYERLNLMKISADGGRPELIAANAGYGVGGSWSADGTILFAPRFNEGLFRVSAGGGVPQRVTSLQPGQRESLHGWPIFVDNGDHYLFLRRTIADEPNQIWSGSLERGSKKLLLQAAALVGVSDNAVFFVRDGSMFTQPFDPKKLQVIGEPRKIIDEVDYSEDAAHSYANAAQSGAVVYAPTRPAPRVEVGWYDYSGRLIETLFETNGADKVRMSDDQTRVAMLKWNARKGAADVYTRDLARGIETRLTGGLSNHRELVWAADGDRIFYSSDRFGMYDLYFQADDSGSPAEPLMRDAADKHPTDASRDGKQLLIHTDVKGRYDIWVLTLTPGVRPRLIMATEGDDTNAQFSPDGQWISCITNQSGRREAYIKPLSGGRSMQVSVDGAAHAEWSADGGSVIFSTHDDMLMIAPLNIEGNEARPEKPRPLFPLPEGVVSWSASRRDQRILMAVTPDASGSNKVINYVSHFD